MTTPQGTPTVRVYVDGRGVDVPAGSTAKDALRVVDAGLVEAVERGERALTDSRGLPAPPDTSVFAGAIFRVVANRAAAAAAGATGRPPATTREMLRRLPKAELHCHLDGSVRPATLLELGREYGKPMPGDDAESLGEHMIVRDAHSLEEYLARFAVTLSVMQTAEALERIAYELAEDVVQDGVRYIEVRYAPVLNVEAGLSLGEAIEAPLRGLARAEREHGIMGRVIICSLRTMRPEVSMELARLAVAYRDRGVVGFDLAGGERGNPASAHADAFTYARAHDLACTVHAGEGDGAASVREAVHICGANRLGHATRLIDDESLTRYVNDRRIALEICLTSNVQTRATDRYETHPFREYYRRGLNVVLNTDNRLMSGTTLTDEYWHAAEKLDFTFDQLVTVAMNGFASAFLPWEERVRLAEEARREIAALAGRA